MWSKIQFVSISIHEHHSDLSIATWGSNEWNKPLYYLALNATYIPELDWIEKKISNFRMLLLLLLLLLFLSNNPCLHFQLHVCSRHSSWSFHRMNEHSTVQLNHDRRLSRLILIAAESTNRWLSAAIGTHKEKT